MDAVAQTVSMLIIDKKKMKLKDAGDVYKRQYYNRIAMVTR